MTYLNGALENCTPTNKNNITLGQTDLQAYTSIIQIYFSTAKDFYTSYCWLMAKPGKFLALVPVVLIVTMEQHYGYGKFSVILIACENTG